MNPFVQHARIPISDKTECSTKQVMSIMSYYYQVGNF